MTITNRAVRGHWQTIQQNHRTGTWWVSCDCPGDDCGGIVTRSGLAGSSNCATHQDALDLGQWHARGERGPAPGIVSQLALFDSI